MAVKRSVRIIDVRKSDDHFTLIDAVAIDNRRIHWQKIFINLPPHVPFDHPTGYLVELAFDIKKIHGVEHYQSVQIADGAYPVLQMK